jgi:hypothetical protein
MCPGLQELQIGSLRKFVDESIIVALYRTEARMLGGVFVVAFSIRHFLDVIGQRRFNLRGRGRKKKSRE